MTSETICIRTSTRKHHGDVHLGIYNFAFREPSMGRNGPHQIGRPTRRAVEETLQDAKKGIYLEQKGRDDVEGTSNGKCAVEIPGMHGRSSMSRTSALVFVLLSACQGGPEAPTPWSPPPKDFVDVGEEPVVVGRLWVMPNPIRVRPDWDGTGAEGDLVTIEVKGIGSENVDVTAVRFEDSGDFVFSAGDPGLELGGYPVTVGGSPDCLSSSGWSFGLAYRPTSGAMETGALVIETRDPTSPTMRIPIVFDTEGTLTRDDPSYPPSYYESYIFAVKPNPIRIPAGSAGATDVCLGVEGYDGANFAITDMRLYGEGLSLPEPVDFLNPRIEYTGTTGTVNGSLVIDFTSTWGDEHTLVVPILVR